MKISSVLITAFLSTFMYVNVQAQNSVKERIIGCWKIEKITFTELQADAPEVPVDMSSTACLQKDGKFVTTTNGQTVTGIYMISDDGKTITQRMTGGTDDVGEITLLTDTELEFKTAEIIMRMSRIKG